MNKALFLAPLKGFLQILPQWFIRAFYWPIIVLFSIFAKLFHLKVWTRNSFYERNQVLFLSDVDFTVLLESSKNKDLLQRVKGFQKVLKIVFPWTGESNFLYSDSYEKYLPLVNFFEAKRDPFLSEKVNSPKKMEIEQLLFIAHFFYSDKQNLLTSLSLRKRKISRILSLTEIDPYLGEESLESLIDYLDSKLFYKFKALRIGEFFKHYLKGADLGDYQKEYLVLYPHHWMGGDSQWSKNELLNQINYEEKEILKRAMENEIWGFYNQPHEKSKFAQRLLHLEQLKTLWSILGFHDQELFLELEDQA